MRNRKGYERDDERWPADAYRVDGWPAVSVRVMGWETEPDEDTEWSGMEARTGRVVVVMVGDDYRHTVGADDLTPLDDLDYCLECGQIGCAHDGRDRSERAS